MGAITIQIISAVTIIGFLWNLHRNVTDLRERMARAEDLLEGFVARSQKLQS